jgi:hypothetical protein
MNAHVDEFAMELLDVCDVAWPLGLGPRFRIIINPDGHEVGSREKGRCGIAAFGRGAAGERKRSEHTNEGEFHGWGKPTTRIQVDNRKCAVSKLF